MSDRKEFNDFCAKNGISNLLAGQQLFEECNKVLRRDWEMINLNRHVTEILEENPSATSEDIIKELNKKRRLSNV